MESESNYHSQNNAAIGKGIQRYDECARHPSRFETSEYYAAFPRLIRKDFSHE